LNPDSREVSPDDVGRTVLLVEDEQDVREMTAEHLRDLGYRVLEAEEGGTHPVSHAFSALGDR
jgi:CheY-like chemotaxis protein